MTIWLKHSLSKANNIQSVLALMLAALGALYNNDNSPKESPGLYAFKYIGPSSFLNVLVQSNYP